MFHTKHLPFILPISNFPQVYCLSALFLLLVYYCSLRNLLVSATLPLPDRLQLFRMRDLDKLEYIIWKIDTKIFKLRSNGMHKHSPGQKYSVQIHWMYVSVYMVALWITSKYRTKKKTKNEWNSNLKLKCGECVSAFQYSEKWYDYKRNVCACLLAVLDSDTNQPTIKEDEEPICAWCIWLAFIM